MNTVKLTYAFIFPYHYIKFAPFPVKTSVTNAFFIRYRATPSDVKAWAAAIEIDMKCRRMQLCVCYHMTCWV